MKKLLLALSFALFAGNTFAVPAWPGPYQHVQSDGTVITYFVHGDEDGVWYTDSQGNILVMQGNDFVVSQEDKQSYLKNKMRKAAMKKEPLKQNSKVLPHTGKPKVLIILANFTDTTFHVSNPRASFNYYLNGVRPPKGVEFNHGETLNYGSVKQYFSEMSNGQFEPQFEIHGPITLKNNWKYYGAYTPATTDSKGNVISNEIVDAHADEAVYDAVNAIKDSVDLKQFDADGDNYIDLVYVIYAGHGNNMAGVLNNDALWPKSMYLTSGKTFNGLKIGRCGISNEMNGSPKGTKIAGVGVFVHEMGHCLGLPDMYVVNNNQAQYLDNQEMEWWDVMDGGFFIPKGNGRQPAAYTEWEKDALGWSKMETLTSAQHVVLEDVTKGGKGYRIMNDNDKTGHEYYFVQNIQNTGWNGQQLGHGMLMVHVDYNQSAFSVDYNRVNSTTGHPRMTVLAADGLLMNQGIADQNLAAQHQNDFYASASGDPFPGTSNVTEITDETTVRPIVYNGTKLNKPIYNIREENGVVSFDFLDKTLSAIDGVVVEKNSDDNRIYNLNGQFVGNDKSALSKGIYIINGKKVIIR